MYEEYINRALQKADLVEDGEEGFITVETKDGMVVKIWYRSVGDDNILNKHEVVTLEEWEWERHGVTNNVEWRRYLNKCFRGAETED